VVGIGDFRQEKGRGSFGTFRVVGETQQDDEWDDLTANENLPTPDGWLVTKEGKPSNDPLEASQKGGFLTPLGGTADGSSYHHRPAPIKITGDATGAGDAFWSGFLTAYLQQNTWDECLSAAARMAALKLQTEGALQDRV
jgi:hypothetical protein